MLNLVLHLQSPLAITFIYTLKPSRTHKKSTVGEYFNQKDCDFTDLKFISSTIYNSPQSKDTVSSINPRMFFYF